jgi:hypothetical protein
VEAAKGAVTALEGEVAKLQTAVDDATAAHRDAAEKLKAKRARLKVRPPRRARGRRAVGA